MNWKKIGDTLLIFSLFVAVIGASIAITFAMGTDLVSFGDPVHNKFKNGNITAVLHENLWDGSTKDTTESQVAALVAADAAEDTPTLGINMASPYTPGVAIPKNPAVTNTSAVTTEWIGVQAYVKVTFEDAYVYYQTEQQGERGDKVFYYSLNEFNKYIATLTDNNLSTTKSTTSAYANKWYYGNATYPDMLYYTSVVPASGTTNPIFTGVNVIAPTANASYDKPTLIDNAKAVSGEYGDGHCLNFFRWRIVRAENESNLANEFTGANSNLRFVYSKQYPTFEIYLKGYAIQGDSTTYIDTVISNINAVAKPTT